MKRLERGIAFRMMIVFLLVLIASVLTGLPRWVALAGAVYILVKTFVRSQKDYPERIAVTVKRFEIVDGQVKIEAVLANIGTLDLFRPELAFRLMDQHGKAIASKSVWPTGQLNRTFTIGGTAPFSVVLPAPADTATTRLLIGSQQYPIELICEFTPSSALPSLSTG